MHVPKNHAGPAGRQPTRQRPFLLYTQAPPINGGPLARLSHPGGALRLGTIPAGGGGPAYGRSPSGPGGLAALLLRTRGRRPYTAGRERGRSVAENRGASAIAAGASHGCP